MKTIYTIFAGRRNNLAIQFKYLDKLISQGDITQVHLWDFTRDVLDSIWLKKLVGNTDAAPYVFAPWSNRFSMVPLSTSALDTHDVSFTFGVKGTSDAHMIIVDETGKPFEFVLGGWNNTRSVCRTVGSHYLDESYGPAFNNDTFTYYTFKLASSQLSLICGRRRVMSIPFNSKIQSFHVAGYPKCSIQYDFECCKDQLASSDSKFPLAPLKNKSAFIYNAVNNKSAWNEYYLHYTPSAYPDTVLVKGDDDIVYIDTSTFRQFIQARVANPNALLVFPGIINNAIVAYYHQKLGVLPEADVGELPYEPFQGRLWASAELCDKVHRYFIQNRDAVLTRAHGIKNHITHKCGDRFSINMFSILSKDLGIFQEICKLPALPPCFSVDDEQHLSVTMSKNMNRDHLCVPQCVVVHLSFYKQVEQGLDEDGLRADYHKISLL